MNSHVSISYEQQLKAAEKARKAKWATKAAKVAQDNEARHVDRVEGVAPSVPAPKQKVIMARFKKGNVTQVQHDAHKRSYMAWRSMTGIEKRPRQYFEGLCWLAGYSPEVIRSATRKRPIVVARRAIIRSIAIAFPLLSSTLIGQLVNREHCTVLFCMGATKKSRKHYTQVRKTNLYAKKLNPEQVAEVRRRLAAGEDSRALAIEFEVSKVTIWDIRDGRTHKDVE